MEHFFRPAGNQILYHFTTVEGARAILRSKTLRLSEFSMMNDKSEYTYARDKFVKTYREREVWVEEVPRWMAAIRLVTHEPATTMMIASLCEDGDDVGLWDRYANQGNGCVIGLDAHWLADRAGVAIRRVSYNPDYLRDFVNAGLGMLQDQYQDNPSDLDTLTELASFFVLDLYAFKDPRFQSEKEIRIGRLTATDESAPYCLIDPGGHRADGTGTPPLPVLRRNGPFGPVRYIDLPLQNDGQDSAIKSVGFGPSTKSACKLLVEQTVCEIPEIEIWQSDVPIR